MLGRCPIAFEVSEDLVDLSLSSQECPANDTLFPWGNGEVTDSPALSGLGGPSLSPRP